MVASIVEPKPGIAMRRVVVPMVVENQEDRDRATRGEIPASEVRRIAVEALVDTGATFCCMPMSLIRQLGLTFRRERETRTVAGLVKMGIYGTACLAVQGRDCTEEVMALPDDRQILLGQIPLEKMDWWIDLANRKLVGNPEHDGQWMAEVF